MIITVYEELEQRSPEWHEARRGIVTASEVHKLLTSKGEVANNDTSRGFIAELAAERITGHVEDMYVSRDMERGILDEPYAIEGYEVHKGVQTEQIGFMVKDYGDFKLGFSPDSLVPDDGFIEVKSRAPRIHINTVLRDAVPAGNMAQIQTGLLVSDRAWCDYISYSGGLPLWIKRVLPDERWQHNILTAVAEAEKAITELITTFKTATHGLPIMERIDHFGDDLEIQI